MIHDRVHLAPGIRIGAGGRQILRVTPQAAEPPQPPWSVLVIGGASFGAGVIWLAQFAGAL